MTYVGNNPVNWIDPWGLMTAEQWEKARLQLNTIEKLNPEYGTGKGQYVCNTLVISAYHAAGINISGRAQDLYKNSVVFTDRTKLKTGDLIYFDYNGDKTIDHVGIYTGTSPTGQLMFSHMTTRSGIRINQLESAFSGHGRQRYGSAIVGFSTHE
jgi:cell wall-associated NlpC family hydrolase